MMLTEFACANCGTPLKAPANYAGKKAKCKQCGSAVLIPPPPGNDGYEIEDPQSDWDTVASQVLSPQTQMAIATRPPLTAPTVAAVFTSPPPLPADAPQEPSFAAASPRPPEPWYYRFLVAYAWFVASLGMLQFGFTSAFFAKLTVEFGPSAIVAWLMVAVVSFSIFLTSLLLAAPVLLFVDVARNVRAMRYNAAVGR